MSTSVVSKPLTHDSTFTQRTESILRDMILDGTIRPGERLNEVALAASLGISRGPLREAVQRLAGDGLLTIVSHRGSYVRTFKRTEVVELYELRSALELHAVRLLCQRASAGDLAHMVSLLAETESLMNQGKGIAYPKELDFHLRLVMLAGNQTLMRAALETHGQLSLARSISAKQPIRARTAIVEHADVLQAIKDRDVHKATDLMQTHIQHSMDSALSVLDLPDINDEKR